MGLTLAYQEIVLTGRRSLRGFLAGNRVSDFQTLVLSQQFLQVIEDPRGLTDYEDGRTWSRRYHFLGPSLTFDSGELWAVPAAGAGFGGP
jgi:hypothetical protein